MGEGARQQRRILTPDDIRKMEQEGGQPIVITIPGEMLVDICGKFLQVTGLGMRMVMIDERLLRIEEALQMPPWKKEAAEDIAPSPDVGLKQGAETEAVGQKEAESDVDSD